MKSQLQSSSHSYFASCHTCFHCLKKSVFPQVYYNVYHDDGKDIFFHALVFIDWDYFIKDRPLRRRHPLRTTLRCNIVVQSSTNIFLSVSVYKVHMLRQSRFVNIVSGVTLQSEDQLTGPGLEKTVFTPTPRVHTQVCHTSRNLGWRKARTIDEGRDGSSGTTYVRLCIINIKHFVPKYCCCVVYPHVHVNLEHKAFYTNVADV